ncbi:MAG: succinate dehydrogenase, cytochrome b556 subunit [Burkholderiales bacterium]|nr:succinate dehydrogenase, cytochrome b556 subunit [Burkholderiales bacterium]
MTRTKRHRIVFFDLRRIGMPVGAVTSILHRITGILLAAGVPWAVYLLDLSLGSSQSYLRAVALLDHWAVRGAAILMAWALAHHAFAGVRHLLADIDVGSRLQAARRSAWLVNLGAVAVTILVARVLL